MVLLKKPYLPFLKMELDVQIMKNGGSTVCAVDSFEKAKRVAAYFGPNGIVIEVEIPNSQLLFHPDYGNGPEFDTIHITSDIDPSKFIKITQTPYNLQNPRPSNTTLRNWKSQNTGIDSKLDKLLDDI